MTYKTKEERAAYAREWRKKNKEHSNEYDRVRSKAETADPEKRAKRTEYMRTYREENPEYQERAKVANKRWAEKNKDHLLEYQREHRAKNLERYREYNAKWYREKRKNRPGAVRALHLRSLYGITPEIYADMLASQGGVCAACGRSPEQERHKVLHVDHCHKSEKIRGLLCSRCNTALGLTEDDPMRLHRYLLARSLPLS